MDKCDADNHNCLPAINRILVISRHNKTLIDELCCKRHTEEYQALWKLDPEPPSKQYLHLHIIPLEVTQNHAMRK